MINLNENNKVRLKGVNLGGWLLMEGYILGGRNIAEREFKNKFRKIHGNEGLCLLERYFRDNFIVEEDFKRISLLGANCIRVPFNYRLIEKKPFIYHKDGFVYLDKVFRWAEEYNLGVILDLHAACGSQNCDWHSDSKGRASLWEKASYRERTCCLWEAIADRYKEKRNLFGYDVLNEPVIVKENTPVLKAFYGGLVRRIQAIDKDHTIFLEGNLWAQEVDFLRDLLTDGVTVSIHAYQPLNHTFHFLPGLKYPGKIDGVYWNKSRVEKYLEKFYNFSRRNKVDIFVGEFGINYRGNYEGEVEYLNDIMEVFDKFSFHYTYWTYKAVAGFCFPDGIYQYLLNPAYVRREGPVYGWENYLTLWKKRKKDIIRFWRTEGYTLNKDIANVLREYFRGQKTENRK
ncbi:MAG: cellulase family glycosylhydrolase [Candidatus Omnitrophota bacterium]